MNARASTRRTAAPVLLAAFAVISLTVVPSAGAKRATLTAPGIAATDCTAGLRDDGATDSRRVSAPYLAALRVRLSARSGDWDVAVFDPGSERVVAGSASRGAREVAGGFVRAGERLVVQACRRSGSDPTATVSIAFERIERGAAEPLQLAKVLTPDRASEARLQSLGLDLTEHGGDGYISVVLHGADDAAALRAAGLRYEVQVADLTAQSARQRAADRRFARRARTSRLPSGRTTYRRLFDYANEMKLLAEQNPDLVRPLTLPNRTYEGRTVEGIEITTDPDTRRDGKPVFLMMGVHHAREWPSGEHTLEWAYELINGYRAGDPRVTPLVQGTRTIIVPIVNPDGFNASREAGEALGHGGGQSGDDILNFATSPMEYRRKNCRLVTDAEAGNCAQPSVGLAEPGVDPNRNYGGLWGGPGASSDQTAQDYRGPGPFSEPETQNIRGLVSKRQVVTLITNHTFSNLVLRPPGLASQGVTVDEPLYKAFGDAMAGENGYTSQPAFKLYDTSGTTEDWSYYATGGLGFTFEIGCNRADPADPTSECIGNFHPPFAEMVAEYEGTSPSAQAVGGQGNREAYFIAQESTAAAERHSVIRGDAPPGAVLRLEKSFQTPTSPQPDEDGEPLLLDDKLTSELKVGDSGTYEWGINPSTRPLVAQDSGRPPLGDPSPSETFSGDPTTTTPCADADTTDPSCFNDHPFTVDGGAGVDNDAVTVTVDWATPISDWDIKVFRDTDGDGTSLRSNGTESEPDSALVGTSAQGAPTTEESTTFINPEDTDGRLLPGPYVVRVVNFAAVDPYEGEIAFAGPEPFTAGTTEAWTFSCTFDGKLGTSQPLTIARGEQQTVDLREACLRGVGLGDLRCTGQRATILGTKDGDRLRGTKGDDVFVLYEGRDKVSGRGGKDRICAGGGKDRIKGGGGKDRIKGQKGRDKLRGGPGGDRLGGGPGKDRLNGGGGRDRCKGGPGRDRLRSC